MSILTPGLISPPDQSFIVLRMNLSLAELERGDITDLIKAGWKAPEVFTAKGRDGQTDIWGVIIRPTNFDPSRSYPVIENIYAGPHGSFVPKKFLAISASLLRRQSDRHAGSS